MALASVELETLVSEPDALTTGPSPYVLYMCQTHLKRKLTICKT